MKTIRETKTFHLSLKDFSEYETIEDGLKTHTEMFRSMGYYLKRFETFGDPDGADSVLYEAEYERGVL